MQPFQFLRGTEITYASLAEIIEVTSDPPFCIFAQT
jgi:hypothetical protein